MDYGKNDFGKIGEQRFELFEQPDSEPDKFFFLII